MLCKRASGDFATVQHGRQIVPPLLKIAKPAANGVFRLRIHFNRAAVQERAETGVPCRIDQIFVRIQQQSEKAWAAHAVSAETGGKSRDFPSDDGFVRQRNGAVKQQNIALEAHQAVNHRSAVGLAARQTDGVMRQPALPAPLPCLLFDTIMQ